jgi:hypothetical protein
MLIMESIRKRIQANERTIQGLQQFQQLTTNKKDLWLVKKESGKNVKFIQGSLVTSVRLIAGTMVKKLSSLIEIIIK